MKLNYRELTEVDAAAIEPWFNDPDTKKYLGDKKWLGRLLELVIEVPGKEFGKLTIKTRTAILADLDKKPVALVDLETYSDNTAGLALLVNPSFRNMGIAKQIHKDAWHFQQMRGINKIIGGVDPDNIASLKSLPKMHTKVSEKLNKDGQFSTVQTRPKSQITTALKLDKS